MKIPGSPAYFFLIVLVLALLYVPATRAGRYRNYDDFMEAFKNLANAHPEMVAYESVGKTVENNDIIMFKIGNPAGGKVLFDGAMHGSETLGSEVLYCYAEWLLTSADSLAKRILTGTYTLLVPALNVDGYNLVRTNAHHVDLNRNFATGWQNAGSNDSSNEYYRGPAPLSEPESQAMVKLFRTLKPRFYVNLHYPGGTYYLGSSYANRTYNSFLVGKINSLSRERGVKPYPYAETNGRGFAMSDAARAGITSFLIELTSNSTLSLQQIGTIILPKFIPIAAILSQESETTFEDGFESGDFRAWNGTLTTSNETASVVDTFSYMGSHSAKFSSDGEEKIEYSYCYKTIPKSDRSYEAGHFYVSKSGMESNNALLSFLTLTAGNNSLASAGWRLYEGVVKWNLEIRNGIDWISVCSVVGPSLNKWYFVELFWFKNKTRGCAELLVNNRPVCSIYDKDTSAFGDKDQVKFGITNTSDCKAATVYCDQCTASKVNFALLLPFDPNHDGNVDIEDMGIIAKAFGSTPTLGNWDWRADINLDEMVNIVDLTVIAKHFREHYV